MRNCLSIILTLGLLGLVGCAASPQRGSAVREEMPPKEPEKIEDAKAQEAFEELEEFLRKGDSEAALGRLEEYREKYPEDRAAPVLQAALLMSQGEIGEARRLLEEVLKAEPRHREALFNLAHLEGFTNNREDQLSLLRRLEEMDPEDGDVHAALGEFHLVDKKKELARKAFSRSLELDEENFSALMGMGNILLLEEEYPEAEEKFLKAAKLQPEDPFVFSDLARSRIAQGEYEKAREDLDRAVEISPEDYWIRMDRGKLLLTKLLKAGEALKDFDKAVELNPDYFYAYVFRAGIYDKTNRRVEAIADYRKLLELRPDYYFSYRSLGTLLYLEQEWEEARKNFEKAFEHERDFGFRLLAGLTFYRGGAPKEGEAYLGKFLETIPRDDNFYALVRMCIDPNYEIFAISKVEKEQNAAIKTRMKFYIGAVMQALGGTSGAAEYYLQVREENLSGLFENQIALGELKNLTGKP